jgi:hypothetical protein
MLAKISSYRKQSLVLHNISNAESSSSQIALVKIMREAAITQTKIKLEKFAFFTRVIIHAIPYYSKNILDQRNNSLARPVRTVALPT